MNTYTFTLLLVPGPELNADLEDQLFIAGCDDALVGVRDDVVFLDFDRQAESPLEAILSAVEAVEAAADGLRVARVEPDELVTAADIARRTGRSRESVRLLINGERGAGRFPTPVSGVHRRSRLWRWSAVVDWLLRHDPKMELTGGDLARTIAAVNGALELRRNAPAASHDVLARLVG